MKFGKNKKITRNREVSAKGMLKVAVRSCRGGDKKKTEVALVVVVGVVGGGGMLLDEKTSAVVFEGTVGTRRKRVGALVLRL